MENISNKEIDQDSLPLLHPSKLSESTIPLLPTPKETPAPDDIEPIESPNEIPEPNIELLSGIMEIEEPEQPQENEETLSSRPTELSSTSRYGEITADFDESNILKT